LAGETEVRGENLPRRHCVHHKSHLPDPSANPGRRGGKAAANRFSYGAADQGNQKEKMGNLCMGNNKHTQNVSWKFRRYERKTFVRIRWAEPSQGLMKYRRSVLMLLGIMVQFTNVLVTIMVSLS
jgi:hypothetical protein